jgi:hypothetical protein
MSVAKASKISALDPTAAEPFYRPDLQSISQRYCERIAEAG